MHDDPADALHVINGTDRNVHVGKVGAEWLVETGVIEYKGFTTGIGHVYVADMPAAEVDSLIMGNAEIRPCDFCHHQGAGWAFDVRPFYMLMGDTTARFERRVVMCDECVELVRVNNKIALIERAIDGAVELARSQGGLAGRVAHTHSRQAVVRYLRPMVTETVNRFLSNRTGLPFELA